MLRYNQQLQNSIKLPLEYKPSTIEFLNALMNGLGYLCLYNIMCEIQGAEVKDENLASLEREISNHFYVVKDILKADKALQKVFGYLLDDVYAKYFEFGINCLVRMANSFEKQHAEAKTKGFIGIQIAYLSEALLLVKNMDKGDNFPEKKNLLKKFEPLKKKHDDAVLMNNQVYNAKIPQRTELTHINPISEKIRPLEPKNIRVLPEEAPLFGAFKSEEMEGVRSSLLLFISNKKQHVEKTMVDLKERITFINKTYNVPILKGIANADQVMSPETANKISQIKATGERGFSDLIGKVTELRRGIDQTFVEIDKTIAAENEKDKQALSMVQGGNYVTFEHAFGDQVAALNGIRNNYREYRVTEEKLLAEFDKYRGLLPQLTAANVDLKSLVSNHDLAAFAQENKEDLTMLKKLSDGLDALVGQHLRAEMETMLTILKEIDVDGLSAKVLMNEKDIQSIYKDINESIGSLALGFEEKVSKVMNPLDKCKEIAQKLNAKNLKIGNGGGNDILVAIDFFFVIFC